MMQLVDIELKMPLQDFENAFQECIDNWPAHMNYNIKSVSTRMGRNMYKLEVNIKSLVIQLMIIVWVM